ncbi:MAG: ATP-binding cassette domain-containing protein [Bacteroidales bacterium]|jgi:predicted ATPase
MIKVTINKDFRGLKKDTFYLFLPLATEFKEQTQFLVGSNGSGKTTLLSAIRGSFEIDNTSDSTSLFEYDFKKLAENVTIEHDYDKVFSYFSVEDDGGNMNNSFDACAFLMNGGYATQKISHGEKQFHYIYTLWEKVKKYHEETPEHKLLILLDEFDKGYSLKMQIMADNVIAKLNNIGCDVICSTHNYFLLKTSNFVYDMDTNSFEKTKTYFLKIGIAFM